MNDAELLTAFESCAISRADWDHRAHVRVGYLLVCAVGHTAGVARMRAGLKALNAANGVVDGPQGGYHETITRAFLLLIDDARRTRGPFDDSHAFCAACSELLDRQVLLRHYSPECLRHPAARTAFREPDLAPLPIECS